MKPRNLLVRVLQFARDEIERRARASELEGALAQPPADARSAVEHDALLRAESDTKRSQPCGLEVLRSHEGGPLTLSWELTEADVARAEALVSGHPVLCLRLVSFSKTRDDVLREVQDRPGIDRSGRLEIQEPTQRAVVSLGVRAGERFVSIAHHVL